MKVLKGRSEHFRRIPFLVLILASIGMSGASSSTSADGEDAIGRRLFMNLCASCHGNAGEGVKGKYPDPLVGDDSVQILAKYIDRWMPENDPEKCKGAEAESVARYIHSAFYSPEARARNNPVRPALSRLTLRQFQNSAADLIGHFRPASKEERVEGLQGKYSNSGNPGGEPQVERIDPAINFKFSDDAALKEKMDPKGFSARWTGSLHAPETGEYGFTIRTDHAARLWVNHREKPLIDAWVKSGSDTEFSGKVHLLGGRTYPLTLEFSSRIQGVEGEYKGEKQGLDGFLELHWNLPHRPLELIPQRRFVSVSAPEVFVLRTPLPPDDRSDGYERGKTVSRAWDEAATEAAIEIADYILENLEGLAGARKGEEEYPNKVRDLCKELATHAFRGPLSESQTDFYIHRQFEKAPDPDSAVKRIALLALKSPRFLYTDLIDPISVDYAIASALSFALWDSLPDEQLLEKAAAGGLHERDQIAAEAERMVGDYRARSKLREFLHQWLKIEATSDLSKRADLFPEFDGQLASDLRTSLDLFLEQILADEDANFRELLLSRELYLNGRLGKFLGLDLPEDAPFERLPTEEAERAGVLTHPYIMAKFAYHDSTSPIHRGVFLARNVLGRGLRPPPEAVTPAPPDLHPGLMTRERVALQTEARACQSCHSLINPLGFTLERFDAVGRIRDTEIGKPVDNSGEYLLPDGSVVRFTDARDLAEFLVEHHETHQAFAVQLHHYLVKQPINAYGPDTSEKLTKFFANNNLNLRRLVCEIAINAALEKRFGSEGEDSHGAIASAARSEPGVRPRATTFLGLFRLCDFAQNSGRWRCGK